MTAISAIIITRNEERNIERCLISLSGVADEIVVVDSFSEDSTPGICKAMGARVFSRSFAGFRDQKAYAESLTVNNLILSLDADEELSPELRNSLTQIKAAEKIPDFFQVNRRNICCGRIIRHSGLYPDRKIRIYNKQSCQWGGLNIHEKIIPDKNTRGGFLKGDIIHHTFNTLSEFEIKIRQYAMISAKEYYKAGMSAGPLKAHLHASWRFFKGYILRGGVFGGRLGYRICLINAAGVWKKYNELRKFSVSQKKHE